MMRSILATAVLSSLLFSIVFSASVVAQNNNANAGFQVHGGTVGTDFLPHGCINVKAALPGGMGGAAGDGSRDDSTAIQTAIEYANSNANPVTHSGCLYFPAGQYKFTVAMNMCATVGHPAGGCRYPQGIVVYGDGENSTILEPDEGTTAPTGVGLDFGGASYSGMHHIGVIDLPGDRAMVGILSSHGGMGGVGGDNFWLDHVTCSMFGGHPATSMQFCVVILATDLSGVSSFNFGSGCTPLVIGDQLGVSAAGVTSPFYNIAKADNGFTMAHIGTANVSSTLKSLHCPALATTGSGDYEFSGITYLTVDGQPTGTNLSGIWDHGYEAGTGEDLFGGLIRTENHSGIAIPALYIRNGPHATDLHVNFALGPEDYAVASEATGIFLGGGTLNCEVCGARVGFFNVPHGTVLDMHVLVGTGPGGLGQIASLMNSRVDWSGGNVATLAAQVAKPIDLTLCANNGCEELGSRNAQYCGTVAFKSSTTSATLPCSWVTANSGCFAMPSNAISGLANVYAQPAAGRVSLTSSSSGSGSFSVLCSGR